MNIRFRLPGKALVLAAGSGILLMCSQTSAVDWRLNGARFNYVPDSTLMYANTCDDGSEFWFSGPALTGLEVTFSVASETDADRPVLYAWWSDDGVRPSSATLPVSCEIAFSGFLRARENVTSGVRYQPWNPRYSDSGSACSTNFSHWNLDVFLDPPAHKYVILEIKEGADDNLSNSRRSYQVLFPQPVLGVDVSHYQNEPGGIDWHAVTNAGKRFVLIKASEGTNSNENPSPGGGQDGTSFTETNVHDALDVKLLVGVYHLARPDLHPALADAESEAANFASRAGGFIGRGFLPPALDLESDRLGSLGSNRAGLSAWVRTWLHTLDGLGRHVKPIIYADRSTFHNLLEDDLKRNYLLWVVTDDNNQTGTPSYENLRGEGELANVDIQAISPRCPKWLSRY